MEKAKRLSVCFLSLQFSSALGKLIAIKRNKINSFQVQRRETAVAGHVMNDATQEWENHPRTFDHQIWVHLILRNVFHAKHTSVIDLEDKELFFSPLVLAIYVQLHRNFVLVFSSAVARFDCNIDLYLWRNFARYAFLGKNVFERKVAYELRHYAHFWRDWRLRFCP